ncbi:MAG: hypothetical protein N2491_05130 [Negativicutes bacterium]|nr:hypothetical protein [Negativicutes bacterium]
MENGVPYVIAGLMASLSFLVNRALLRRLGPTVVITLGPAMEETAKTLLPYYLGVDIFVTHAAFGLFEATYDYVTGGKQKWAAAAASVAGHALFGFITVSVLRLSGSLPLALASACVLHIGWNVAAILICARKDKVT